MPQKKDIWNRIRSDLEVDLSQSDFNRWFLNTDLVEFAAGRAVIKVPNKFVGAWLKDKHLHRIQEAFSATTGLSPEIRFVAAQDTASHGRAEKPAPTGRLNKNRELNASGTFEAFLTGSSNRFAYSCSVEVSTNPASFYNPLYIYGNQGVGKTHLLHAIANASFRERPRAKAMYMSEPQQFFRLLPQLSRQVGSAAENAKVAPAFVLVDAFDVSGHSAGMQQKAASTIDILCNSGTQIVLAARRSPPQMTALLPRLRSRLQWGVIAEIQPPEEPLKTAFLQARATQNGVKIPRDVLFFLAKSTDSMKNLAQIVVRLTAYCSLSGRREIELSTAKSLIHQQEPKTISVEEIQKVVAMHFDITVQELLSNNKKRMFSYPRQIAMYMARTMTDLSLEEIAAAFRKKDHSTVLYALNRIEKEKDLNKDIHSDIHGIQAIFM